MELSKEEQEAIKNLKLFLQKEKNYMTNDKLEIILNLISKLQKENEKQSKVIDEMADKLYKLKIKLELNDLLEDCFIPREFSDIDDCVKKDCKECIKQYFYRKGENND